MRPVAPFQPKARYLPEDLRSYAAGGWWYRNRDKCVGVACALLWAATLALPEAAQDAGPAIQSVGAIPSASAAPVAAPLCPRIQDGHWLRIMVKQRNYSGFEWHECYYGKIDRRDWQ